MLISGVRTGSDEPPTRLGSGAVFFGFRRAGILFKTTLSAVPRVWLCGGKGRRALGGSHSPGSRQGPLIRTAPTGLEDASGNACHVSLRFAAGVALPLEWQPYAALLQGPLCSVRSKFPDDSALSRGDVHRGLRAVRPWLPNKER